MDGGLEVHGGPALLVHDPNLDRAARQVEGLFHEGEHLVRKRNFGRTMHLRLDDIDRTVARVTPPEKVVLADQHGAHGVEQTLENLVPVAVEHSRRRHQVAHVADQHQ